MKNTQPILEIFLLLLFGFIMGYFTFHGNTKTIKGDTITMIKRDTVKIIDSQTVTKDNFIYKTNIKTVILPSKIDTESVIKGYFSYKTYSDTFKTKNGEIIVKDSIQGDSLVEQTVISTDTSKIITDSIFIAPKKSFDIYILGGYNYISKIPYAGMQFSYGRFTGNITTNSAGFGYKINKK